MKAQGDKGDTLLLASVPPETAQVGAKSVCLGVNCRVGGHFATVGRAGTWNVAKRWHVAGHHPS